MPYNMKSKSGEVYKCGHFEYELIICTAKQHGWVPMGTQYSVERQFLFGLPKYCDFGVCEHWPGIYLSTCEQKVRKKDARNMARALEEALVHMKVEEYAILFRDFIKFLRLGSYVTW